MNRNGQITYDFGYLAAIKDVKALIKRLDAEYDKGIPTSLLQDEIKALHLKYLAFTKK